MKSELDSLMAARGLDALIIWIDEIYSPPLDYLTDGAHITQGMLVKKQGAAPVLYVSPMETEEAAKSGLAVHKYHSAELYELYKTLPTSKANAARWLQILSACGVESGTVGIYGAGDFAFILGRIEELKAAETGIHFTGEPNMNKGLFKEAFETKDADELLRMKSVAARTDQALEAAWNYIASHHLEDGRILDDAGTPLTIGAVKRFVRRTLLDYDLEDTGMIFAQGRDAGFPHSRGEANMELRPGQSIVFDLFPQEIGGGYFHDVTRTWSLDYATPEVEAAYNQVMEAFDIGVELARAGMPAKDVQIAVQNYFEANGHSTLRSHPGTQEGYVHSLGHGLGLNIHEAPGISHISSDMLRAGNVISIEPGLYYPERGFGVRVEDTCYIGEDGQLVPLTGFRKDLVLPLKR
ncbi:MAG: aminopeptidase P family protein [Anaerolineae bacterium]|nr:aminopeptidase P family protein [Anaerolineae bacterium]